MHSQLRCPTGSNVCSFGQALTNSCSGLRDSGSGEDDPWHWRNPVPRELVHSPFGEEVASPKAAAVEGRSERCVASSSGCLASRGRDVSVSLKQGGEVSLPQLPEKQAVS